MAHILVVDDEEDILETLPDVLQRWGHTTFIARNGIEGLKIYKSRPIDFVISDIKMPEMDGLELLSKIQEIDKKSMVIFLTGYPSLDSAINAMRAGAYDYLVKPVNLDELKLRIERGIERVEHLKVLPLLRGLNWALLVSIPLWLVLGIILAKLLR
ncbi:MAG TPA: response regulator [bacterium]|nr:response regulator [bacterium]HNT66856.1 response regulator [bacterium]HOX85703.1 response regulator [bacterium]HPG44862.1 response regulator [bacterium]HPM98109.1 response regulator [bacterium]